MNYGTLTKSDAFPKDEYSGLLPPKEQPNTQETVDVSLDKKAALYFVSGALSALFLLLLTTRKK